jgi:hypothetical protein
MHKRLQAAENFVRRTILINRAESAQSSYSSILGGCGDARKAGKTYLLMFLVMNCSAEYPLPATSRIERVPLGHVMEGSGTCAGQSKSKWKRRGSACAYWTAGPDAVDSHAPSPAESVGDEKVGRVRG